MSTNPLDFVSNFLAQPYPTKGMAPSAVAIKTGGTIVQAGSGSDGLGKTSDSMWARIASGIPFGWSLQSLIGGAKVAVNSTEAVKAKVEQGAQAVENKVSSTVQSATGVFTNLANTGKWVIVGIVAVAFIVFAAQVKTLIPRGN